MDNLKAVYILYMSGEIPKDFTSYAHVKRFESRVTRWLNKFSIFSKYFIFCLWDSQVPETSMVFGEKWNSKGIMSVGTKT